MNQTLINFLLILKNASLKKLKSIHVVYNLKILHIIKLLYKEGFIQSFSCVLNKQYILIYFRYPLNSNLLKNIKILSTPTKPVYLKYSDLIKILNKKILLVLCDSQLKFLTLTTCKKLKIGGVACFIC